MLRKGSKKANVLLQGERTKIKKPRMKIGIMQPYFFPYIGYFQLIEAVDVYVNLDHVSFMKRSYMTRNSLKNNTTVNVQVSDASQNKRCKDVFVNYDHGYLSKFQKTLENLYKKSENYYEVMHLIVDPVFSYDNRTISELNFDGIKRVCSYLNIQTKMIDSSEDFCLPEDKKEIGLKTITKKLGGSEYINAIGGTKLYNKEDFANDDIQLHFIQMGSVDLKDPYLSILHQLFTYPKEHVQNQLFAYNLV